MKNSQMYALMGISILGHQMHGWPGIALGTWFFALALLAVFQEYK